MKAPTRLEILNKLEGYLREGKIDEALNYICNVKDLVVKELERIRQRRQTISYKLNLYQKCIDLFNDKEFIEFLKKKRINVPIS